MELHLIEVLSWQNITAIISTLYAILSCDFFMRKYTFSIYLDLQSIGTSLWIRNSDFTNLYWTLGLGIWTFYWDFSLYKLSIINLHQRIDFQGHWNNIKQFSPWHFPCWTQVWGKLLVYNGQMDKSAFHCLEAKVPMVSWLDAPRKAFSNE